MTDSNTNENSSKRAACDGRPNGNKRQLETRVKAFMQQCCENALPLTALADPKIQFWLEQADVVWGFDVAKNNLPSLFFGKERLLQCIKEEKPFTARVVSFLFDSRTDSLEYLGAAVQALKGSDCYNQ